MKNHLLLYTISILVGFLILPIQYVSAEVTGAISLDSLIDEALENNPEIQAAYSNWEAVEYRIKQVSSLPDPTARYTYFGENVETKVGPQEHKYGVSQKVPFPGKLSLKGKAQSKQADMLGQKYEATKREVIKNIKFVYYDIFWIGKAIDITEEEKNILDNLEKVANLMYHHILF